MMINPGDALLKEGIPVPEPNTISSFNVFPLIEIILLKYARIPPSSAGRMNGLPSPLGPACPEPARFGAWPVGRGGRPYGWVILFSLFAGNDPVMTH